jgi:hypothetical protein
MEQGEGERAIETRQDAGEAGYWCGAPRWSELRVSSWPQSLQLKVWIS